MHRKWGRRKSVKKSMPAILAEVRKMGIKRKGLLQSFDKKKKNEEHIKKGDLPFQREKNARSGVRCPR